ncbi:cysteine desulfurase family protein [Microvirga arabica]|uniref:cysteine desulfurase n=1 Tax=Microvirga arabica TaxID=1128671 RepID=A0ABV6YG06_9HYPH
MLAAARALANEGFEIDVVPIGSDGVVDIDAVAACIDERTAIVSVMAVNNEVGVIQPITAIGAICRSAGALFHSDCAQALTAIPIDVQAWNVDLLSLSAHKAYGPKGIGALYVRRAIRSRVRPLMFGGGQEEGLRPGTLPTTLCVGFGAACKILTHELDVESLRMAAMRDRLFRLLSLSCPDVMINGAREPRHPGNLNIRFPRVDADLLLAAARPRLAIATGSACTSGIPEPSHVLLAMGLNSEEAGESVRVSLGRFTTADEIAETAEILIAAAREAREPTVPNPICHDR